LMTSMGTARDYSASSMVMEEPKYPNTVPMWFLMYLPL
jgi:hypothetical protein